MLRQYIAFHRYLHKVVVTNEYKLQNNKRSLSPFGYAINIKKINNAYQASCKYDLLKYILSRYDLKYCYIIDDNCSAYRVMQNTIAFVILVQTGVVGACHHHFRVNNSLTKPSRFINFNMFLLMTGRLQKQFPSDAWIFALIRKLCKWPPTKRL